MTGSLYDINPNGAADTNISAHPGGGVETLEIFSREGIVEDIYEAHMKTLEIAMKSARLESIASLASEIDEKFGPHYASMIDSILAKYAKVSDVDDYIGKILAFLDKSVELGPLSFIRSAQIEKLKGLFLSIKEELLKTEIDWGEIERIIGILLSSELNTGSWSQVLELDLEQELGGNFNHYYNMVKDLASFLRNKKDEVTSPDASSEKDSLRSREEDPELTELKKNSISVMENIQMLSREAKSIANTSTLEAKRISEIYAKVDLAPLKTFKKTMSDLQSMDKISAQSKQWFSDLMVKVTQLILDLRNKIFQQEVQSG